MQELIKAFIKAKKEFLSPKKNTKGHNYKYSDLTEILNCITEPLLENGLVISQSIISNPDAIGIRTTLFHESGESIQEEFFIPTTLKSLNKGNQLQELGSSITYMKRYALIAMFALGNEDDDGAVFNNKQPQKPANAPVNNPNKQLMTKLADRFEPTQMDVREDPVAFKNILSMNQFQLKKAIEIFDTKGSTSALDYIITKKEN